MLHCGPEKEDQVSEEGEVWGWKEEARLAPVRPEQACVRARQEFFLLLREDRGVWLEVSEEVG